MHIVIPIKIVPDDQDIQVSADRTLDASKAHQIVSSYDLNALEVAAQLAAAVGGTTTAVSVGSSAIDDSKLRKNVLSRGIDQLVLVADDACSNLDAHATAAVLAEVISTLDYDLVVCGDGSADNYAQQVDVQLAAQLGLPCVTSAIAIRIEDGIAYCDRMLETQLEAVRVSLPAVVSVSPDAAQPRIPGMKDILAAGKKPASVRTAEAPIEKVIEIIETKAPEQAERKNIMLDASNEGDVETFASALKSAL